MLNLKSYRLIMCLFMAFALLQGCTSSVSYTTQVPDPDRIRFSGKGAGAGMMLMGSMGPAGIAIGVAIDEGIGKDIDEAATQSGVNVIDVIKHQFDRAINRYCSTKVCSKSGIQLNIRRYGYKIHQGSEQVVPVLEGNVVLNEQTLEFSFPAKEDVLSPIDLDTVKSDGLATQKQFNDAAKALFNRLLK